MKAVKKELSLTKQKLEDTVTVKLRYEKIISRVLKNEKSKNPRSASEIINTTPKYKLVAVAGSSGEMELKLVIDKKKK